LVSLLCLLYYVYVFSNTLRILPVVLGVGLEGDQVKEDLATICHILVMTVMLTRFLSISTPGAHALLDAISCWQFN
jgi:hypothetical protein